uniref:Uncharacterized protein n=3 Tax=Chromera velia CCMP2878 TaxID=1169474 RepID=A0A0K6SAB4_9ALVE|eukprot:Cvel_1593.t2-p1 / transcript=Cvel_1593.t2 / gene=Cvel_1593 / organism=Chromera_velia_CCMP2878 / gene_product=hypothetical protein / transcript_product=hypothetical protein / location=Cvel_scaffold57:14786-45613(-) / protein_length=4946 / sequence_SO=supercontig / SO=protein_coding / is_pseudo=false
MDEEHRKVIGREMKEEEEREKAEKERQEEKRLRREAGELSSSSASSSSSSLVPPSNCEDLDEHQKNKLNMSKSPRGSTKLQNRSRTVGFAAALGARGSGRLSASFRSGGHRGSARMSVTQDLSGLRRSTGGLSSSARAEALKKNMMMSFSQQAASPRLSASAAPENPFSLSSSVRLNSTSLSRTSSLFAKPLDQVKNFREKTGGGVSRERSGSRRASSVGADGKLTIRRLSSKGATGKSPQRKLSKHSSVPKDKSKNRTSPKDLPEFLLPQKTKTFSPSDLFCSPQIEPVRDSDGRRAGSSPQRIPTPSDVASLPPQEAGMMKDEAQKRRGRWGLHTAPSPFKLPDRHQHSEGSSPRSPRSPLSTSRLPFHGNASRFAQGLSSPPGETGQQPPSSTSPDAWKSLDLRGPSAQRDLEAFYRRLDRIFDQGSEESSEEEKQEEGEENSNKTPGSKKQRAQRENRPTSSNAFTGLHIATGDLSDCRGLMEENTHHACDPRSLHPQAQRLYEAFCNQAVQQKFPSQSHQAASSSPERPHGRTSRESSPIRKKVKEKDPSPSRLNSYTLGNADDICQLIRAIQMERSRQTAQIPEAEPKNRGDAKGEDEEENVMRRIRERRVATPESPLLSHWRDVKLSETSFQEAGRGIMHAVATKRGLSEAKGEGDGRTLQKRPFTEGGYRLHPSSISSGGKPSVSPEREARHSPPITRGGRRPQSIPHPLRHSPLGTFLDSLEVHREKRKRKDAFKDFMPPLLRALKGMPQSECSRGGQCVSWQFRVRRRLRALLSSTAPTKFDTHRTRLLNLAKKQAAYDFFFLHQEIVEEMTTDFREASKAVWNATEMTHMLEAHPEAFFEILADTLDMEQKLDYFKRMTMESLLEEAGVDPRDAAKEAKKVALDAEAEAQTASLLARVRTLTASVFYSRVFDAVDRDGTPTIDLFRAAVAGAVIARVCRDTTLWKSMQLWLGIVESGRTVLQKSTAVDCATSTLMEFIKKLQEDAIDYLMNKEEKRLTEKALTLWRQRDPLDVAMQVRKTGRPGIGKGQRKGSMPDAGNPPKSPDLGFVKGAILKPKQPRAATKDGKEKSEAEKKKKQSLWARVSNHHKALLRDLVKRGKEEAKKQREKLKKELFGRILGEKNQAAKLVEDEEEEERERAEKEKDSESEDSDVEVAPSDARDVFECSIKEALSPEFDPLDFFKKATVKDVKEKVVRRHLGVQKLMEIYDRHGFFVRKKLLPRSALPPNERRIIEEQEKAEEDARRKILLLKSQKSATQSYLNRRIKEASIERTDRILQMQALVGKLRQTKQQLLEQLEPLQKLHHTLRTQQDIRDRTVALIDKESVTEKLRPLLIKCADKSRNAGAHQEVVTRKFTAKGVEVAILPGSRHFAEECVTGILERAAETFKAEMDLALEYTLQEANIGRKGSGASCAHCLEMLSEVKSKLEVIGRLRPVSSVEASGATPGSPTKGHTLGFEHEFFPSSPTHRKIVLENLYVLPPRCARLTREHGPVFQAVKAMMQEAERAAVVASRLTYVVKALTAQRTFAAMTDARAGMTDEQVAMRQKDLENRIVMFELLLDEEESTAIVFASLALAICRAVLREVLIIRRNASAPRLMAYHTFAENRYARILRPMHRLVDSALQGAALRQRDEVAVEEQSAVAVSADLGLRVGFAKFTKTCRSALLMFLSQSIQAAEDKSDELAETLEALGALHPHLGRLRAAMRGQSLVNSLGIELAPQLQLEFPINYLEVNIKAHRTLSLMRRFAHVRLSTLLRKKWRIRDAQEVIEVYVFGAFRKMSTEAATDCVERLVAQGLGREEITKLIQERQKRLLGRHGVQALKDLERAEYDDKNRKKGQKLKRQESRRARKEGGLPGGEEGEGEEGDPFFKGLGDSDSDQSFVSSSSSASSSFSKFRKELFADDPFLAEAQLSLPEQEDDVDSEAERAARLLMFQRQMEEAEKEPEVEVGEVSPAGKALRSLEAGTIPCKRPSALRGYSSFVLPREVPKMGEDDDQEGESAAMRDDLGRVPLPRPQGFSPSPSPRGIFKTERTESRVDKGLQEKEVDDEDREAKGGEPLGVSFAEELIPPAGLRLPTPADSQKMKGEKEKAQPVAIASIEETRRFSQPPIGVAEKFAGQGLLPSAMGLMEQYERLDETPPLSPATTESPPESDLFQLPDGSGSNTSMQRLMNELKDAEDKAAAHNELVISSIPSLPDDIRSPGLSVRQGLTLNLPIGLQRQVSQELADIHSTRHNAAAVNFQFLRQRGFSCPPLKFGERAEQDDIDALDAFSERGQFLREGEGSREERSARQIKRAAYFPKFDPSLWSRHSLTKADEQKKNETASKRPSMLQPFKRSPQIGAGKRSATSPRSRKPRRSLLQFDGSDDEQEEKKEDKPSGPALKAAAQAAAFVAPKQKAMSVVDFNARAEGHRIGPARGQMQGAYMVQERKGETHRNSETSDVSDFSPRPSSKQKKKEQELKETAYQRRLRLLAARRRHFVSGIKEKEEEAKREQALPMGRFELANLVRQRFNFLKRSDSQSPTSSRGKQSRRIQRGRDGHMKYFRLFDMRNRYMNLHMRGWKQGGTGSRRMRQQNAAAEALYRSLVEAFSIQSRQPENSSVAPWPGLGRKSAAHLPSHFSRRLPWSSDSPIRVLSPGSDSPLVQGDPKKLMTQKGKALSQPDLLLQKKNSKEIGCQADETLLGMQTETRENEGEGRSPPQKVRPHSAPPAREVLPLPPRLIDIRLVDENSKKSAAAGSSPRRTQLVLLNTRGGEFQNQRASTRGSPMPALSGRNARVTAMETVKTGPIAPPPSRTSMLPDPRPEFISTSHTQPTAPVSAPPISAIQRAVTSQEQKQKTPQRTPTPKTGSPPRPTTSSPRAPPLNDAFLGALRPRAKTASSRVFAATHDFEDVGGPRTVHGARRQQLAFVAVRRHWQKRRDAEELRAVSTGLRVRVRDYEGATRRARFVRTSSRKGTHAEGYRKVVGQEGQQDTPVSLSSRPRTFPQSSLFADPSEMMAGPAVTVEGGMQKHAAFVEQVKADDGYSTDWQEAEDLGVESRSEADASTSHRHTPRPQMYSRAVGSPLSSPSPVLTRDRGIGTRERERRDLVRFLARTRKKVASIPSSRPATRGEGDSSVSGSAPNALLVLTGIRTSKAPLVARVKPRTRKLLHAWGQRAGTPKESTSHTPTPEEPDREQNSKEIQSLQSAQRPLFAQSHLPSKPQIKTTAVFRRARTFTLASGGGMVLAPVSLRPFAPPPLPPPPLAASAVSNSSPLDSPIQPVEAREGTDSPDQELMDDPSVILQPSASDFDALAVALRKRPLAFHNTPMASRGPSRGARGRGPTPSRCGSAGRQSASRSSRPVSVNRNSRGWPAPLAPLSLTENENVGFSVLSFKDPASLTQPQGRPQTTQRPPIAAPAMPPPPKQAEAFGPKSREQTTPNQGVPVTSRKELTPKPSTFEAPDPGGDQTLSSFQIQPAGTSGAQKDVERSKETPTEKLADSNKRVRTPTKKETTRTVWTGRLPERPCMALKAQAEGGSQRVLSPVSSAPTERERGRSPLVGVEREKQQSVPSHQTQSRESPNPPAMTAEAEERKEGEIGAPHLLSGNRRKKAHSQSPKRETKPNPSPNRNVPLEPLRIRSPGAVGPDAPLRHPQPSPPIAIPPLNLNEEGKQLRAGIARRSSFFREIRKPAPPRTRESLVAHCQTQRDQTRRLSAVVVRNFAGVGLAEAELKRQTARAAAESAASQPAVLPLAKVRHYSSRVEARVESGVKTLRAVRQRMLDALRESEDESGVSADGEEEEEGLGGDEVYVSSDSEGSHRDDPGEARDAPLSPSPKFNQQRKESSTDSIGSSRSRKDEQITGRAAENQLEVVEPDDRSSDVETRGEALGAGAEQRDILVSHPHVSEVVAPSAPPGRPLPSPPVQGTAERPTPAARPGTVGGPGTRSFRKQQSKKEEDGLGLHHQSSPLSPHVEETDSESETQTEAAGMKGAPKEFREVEAGCQTRSEGLSDVSPAQSNKEKGQTREELPSHCTEGSSSIESSRAQTSECTALPLHSEDPQKSHPPKVKSDGDCPAVEEPPNIPINSVPAPKPPTSKGQEKLWRTQTSREREEEQHAVTSRAISTAVGGPRPTNQQQSRERVEDAIAGVLPLPSLHSADFLQSQSDTESSREDGAAARRRRIKDRSKHTRPGIHPKSRRGGPYGHLGLSDREVSEFEDFVRDRLSDSENLPGASKKKKTPNSPTGQAAPRPQPAGNIPEEANAEAAFLAKTRYVYNPIVDSGVEFADALGEEAGGVSDEKGQDETRQGGDSVSFNPERAAEASREGSPGRKKTAAERSLGRKTDNPLGYRKGRSLYKMADACTPSIHSGVPLPRSRAKGPPVLYEPISVPTLHFPPPPSSGSRQGKGMDGDTQKPGIPLSRPPPISMKPQTAGLAACAQPSKPRQSEQQGSKEVSPAGPSFSDSSGAFLSSIFRPGTAPFPLLARTASPSSPNHLLFPPAVTVGTAQKRTETADARDSDRQQLTSAIAGSVVEAAEIANGFRRSPGCRLDGASQATPHWQTKQTKERVGLQADSSRGRGDHELVKEKSFGDDLTKCMRLLSSRNCPQSSVPPATAENFSNPNPFPPTRLTTGVPFSPASPPSRPFGALPRPRERRGAAAITASFRAQTAATASGWSRQPFVMRRDYVLPDAPTCASAFSPSDANSPASPRSPPRHPQPPRERRKTGTSSRAKPSPTLLLDELQSFMKETSDALDALAVKVNQGETEAGGPASTLPQVPLQKQPPQRLKSSLKTSQQIRSAKRAEGKHMRINFDKDPNEYICRASDDVTKVTVMVAENDDSLTGVCKMCIPADDTGMVSNLFDWSKYINWREDFWPGEMAFQDNKGRKARNLRVSLTSGSVVPSDGSITKEFPVYGYTAGGGQQTVMMECLCVDATFGRVPTFSSKAGASAKIFKLVH